MSVSADPKIKIEYSITKSITDNEGFAGSVVSASAKVTIHDDHTTLLHVVGPVNFESLDKIKRATFNEMREWLARFMSALNFETISPFRTVMSGPEDAFHAVVSFRSTATNFVNPFDVRVPDVANTTQAESDAKGILRALIAEMQLHFKAA